MFKIKNPELRKYGKFGRNYNLMLMNIFFEQNEKCHFTLQP